MQEALRLWISEREVGRLRGLKSFLVSMSVVAVIACFAAAMLKVAPLAQVAAGAGVLLIVVVFSAARAGAPRWFGLRHLAGLLLAAVAILFHWGAMIGLADAPAGLAGVAAFDGGAAVDALSAPKGWVEAVHALAAKTRLQAGGTVLEGSTLAAVWMVEAGLIALFGLLGGHAAYWRHRARL